MLLPTLISMNKHGSELYFARFAFFFLLGAKFSTLLAAVFDS